MESYEILKDLAIIVIAAKFMAIVARKLKAPQVVGEILAGLIIGPCVLGIVQQTDFIVQMAEIGVILLMFSAGLETNLKDLTSPFSALTVFALRQLTKISAKPFSPLYTNLKATSVFSL